MIGQLFSSLLIAMGIVAALITLGVIIFGFISLITTYTIPVIAGMLLFAFLWSACYYLLERN